MEAQLVYDENGGLALASGGMRLQGDFSRMARRLRPHNLNRELLVRAARIRGAHEPLRAVDATAGLGEDALLLAAAGFDVTMFERDHAIATLLRDALRRARHDPHLATAANRMTLVEADAIEGLQSLSTSPDVIYLDPMFPARQKSAATNKKLQLFRTLEHPCTDAEAEALMRAALEARPRKIVVKRPLKGPHLAGIKPSHSLAGKVVRYDVVVP